MIFPEKISREILHILGMPDLNQRTKSNYVDRLGILRKQMKKLAVDFTAYTPSEERYADAYFAYNFPMNVVKTMAVIEEMILRYPDFMLGRRRLNVLDIGCGDGAGICGVYHGFKNNPRVRGFDLAGIDGSGKMLKRARLLGQWLSENDSSVKIRLRKQRIEDPNTLRISKRYDVILFVNSLAEIIKSEEIPVWFILSVLSSLSDGGLLVIIEPALKKFVRRLMRLRDGLVVHQKGNVILPCLHDKPCALMSVAGRKEWCHQSVRWAPPNFLDIINEGLNREIGVLKFGYLVVTKSMSPHGKHDGYRVVSDLLKEKGKKRCFLCTSQGRVELTRLNKSRTQINACFDSVNKGDVLELLHVRAKKKNQWQVTDSTKVTVL